MPVARLILTYDLSWLLQSLVLTSDQEQLFIFGTTIVEKISSCKHLTSECKPFVIKLALAKAYS